MLGELLLVEDVVEAEADVVADIEASGRAYASSRAIVIAFAFTGTASQVKGLNFAEIAGETLAVYDKAIGQAA